MDHARRVAVFIDGGNFYHRLKELRIPNTLQFGYRQFIQSLAGSGKIVYASYYVGRIKDDPRFQKIRSNQLALFNLLTSKDQNFTIRLGDLVETNGTFHEKGVDVQLAVDMISGAYENIYDEALLISSDKDLLPAVRQVRRLNKRVGYIGFSHKPTRALQWEATFYKLLNREEIVPFCVA